MVHCSVKCDFYASNAAGKNVFCLKKKNTPTAHAIYSIPDWVYIEHLKCAYWVKDSPIFPKLTLERIHLMM